MYFEKLRLFVWIVADGLGANSDGGGLIYGSGAAQDGDAKEILLCLLM